jgi:alpha-ketoglutarate-dependent taurine dioxygenase
MATMNARIRPTATPYAILDISNASSYRCWRDAKLARRPRSADELVVEIGGLRDVGVAAATALRDRIRRANMAIYTCRDRAMDRPAIAAFARGFGLRRLDQHLCADEGGITALRVTVTGRRNDYVPYSNRGLSWHTDGYYNEFSDRVRAVILHCVRDAVDGGENALLDPEIAYIELREADPRFITALSHPRCMTIPANRENGREIRPPRSGPVFSFDAASGALHMRFTARKKHVVWRDDAITRAAVAHLHDLLADRGGPVLHYRLRPGQGIISNNVLHNRAAFTNGPANERLVYRARYFNRLHATEQE